MKISDPSTAFRLPQAVLATVELVMCQARFDSVTGLSPQHRRISQKSTYRDHSRSKTA